MGGGQREREREGVEAVQTSPWGNCDDNVVVGDSGTGYTVKS